MTLRILDPCSDTSVFFNNGVNVPTKMIVPMYFDRLIENLEGPEDQASLDYDT